MATLSWIIVVVLGSAIFGSAGYTFGYFNGFSDGVKEVKRDILYKRTKNKNQLISEDDEGE